MAENGLLTVHQNVKVVLFYAETKSSDSEMFSFTLWYKVRSLQTDNLQSLLGTIFKPMRINSVPDVKCFCKNKNVLRVQSMV